MRGLVAGIMWDVGCRMEKIVDAVSTVGFVDGAAISFGVLLDNSTKVAEQTVDEESDLQAPVLREFSIDLLLTLLVWPFR
jgi:hypothetical protein